MAASWNDHPVEFDLNVVEVYPSFLYALPINSSSESKFSESKLLNSENSAFFKLARLIAPNPTPFDLASSSEYFSSEIMLFPTPIALYKTMSSSMGGWDSIK